MKEETTNFRWSLAILMFFISRTEKGRASSFMLAGVFFGSVVGPSITVALMTTFGWRSVL